MIPFIFFMETVLFHVWFRVWLERWVHPIFRRNDEDNDIYDDLNGVNKNDFNTVKHRIWTLACHLKNGVHFI
jgi:hypothetical protein